MSVIVVCDDKIVLKLSNSYFSLFHETIMHIIEKEHLKIDSDLESLLEKLDQNVYGPGGVFADVAEFLKTKKQVIFFAELIEKAAHIRIENTNPTPGYIEKLKNLHIELVNFAQTLK